MVAVRLLTIDSATLGRMGMAHALSASPDIQLVGTAGTAAEARRMVAEISPDVVTVDAELPDVDGLAFGGTLRRTYPSLGVVLLAWADDDLLFRALEAGVSAFVPRSAPVDSMLAAIRHAAVAAGSFTAPDLAAALARRRTRSALLSPREREVLILLRDGMSVPRIAEALRVSESTVKTYVSRLYEKLAAGNRVQAVMSAVHRGLIPQGRATS